MMLTILLSGQLRTAEKVWPVNKLILGQEDYRIFLVTSNTDLKSNKRRTTEETKELAYKIYGDKLRAIQVFDDVSMEEDGTWISHCEESGLSIGMYDNGTNAFDPKKYIPGHLIFDLENTIVSKLEQELTRIHPRYQDDIRYRVKSKPYLTPLSGRELQFHKRNLVWTLFKTETGKESLNDDIIITRPDFLFESGVIEKCRIWRGNRNSNILYVYPLHEYKFSDVFAFCSYPAAALYCAKRTFDMVRLAGFVELDQLIENLVVKTSNPNACENILSYYTIPKNSSFELEYISQDYDKFITNIIRPN